MADSATSDRAAAGPAPPTPALRPAGRRTSGGRPAPEAPTGPGGLHIVATPIGNLTDLSARARDTLAAADHLLAEDTRRARVLLAHIGVAARPVSLHAHNEASRVARALRWLSAGKSVALISDAGTPLLSDPGERLVRAALDDGHDVVPVPGPSAILAALVASGLPCVPFTFVGFLPRKAGKRARALERIIDATETTVLFESAARLPGLLDDLAARADGAPPGRRIAVCRELTKVHEEVFRGTPRAARRHFGEHPARGEVTIVLEGRAGGTASADAATAEALAAEALDAGLAPTAAAREVARRSGMPRGAAYAVVMGVRARRGGGGGGAE